MNLYRKKPITVEAMEWDGSRESAQAIRDWVEQSEGPCSASITNLAATRLMIHTLEGTMEAAQGDYIIRGAANEFYPCKPAIFGATYDPV